SQKAHDWVYGQHVVERPSIKISLTKVFSKFWSFIKIFIVILAPAPSGTRHAFQNRCSVHERFYDFFRQEYGPVTSRIDQKFPHGLSIAGPVRRECCVQGEAVERLVCPKHATK